MANNTSAGAQRTPTELILNRTHHHQHNNNNNHHHHHHQPHQAIARRQSVARLLPDISKLRLLSWLVEASSELVNCDIAIMDGVYAKLNRSRESLLFWQQSQSQSHQTPASMVAASPDTAGVTAPTSRPPPPPPPTVQPVANKFVISQQQQKQILQLQQQQRQQQQQALEQSQGNTAGKCNKLSASIDSGTGQRARTHHSLPSTNYGATTSSAAAPTDSTACKASLVADSSSSPSGSGKRLFDNKRSSGVRNARGQPTGCGARDISSLPIDLLSHARTRASRQGARDSVASRGRLVAGEQFCDSNNHSKRDDEQEDDHHREEEVDLEKDEGEDVNGEDEDEEEEEEEDDVDEEDEDDDDSSATSSTTSSGIHGASLSSSASTSSSSGSSNSSSDSSCASSSCAGSSVNSFDCPQLAALSNTTDNQQSTSTSRGLAALSPLSPPPPIPPPPSQHPLHYQQEKQQQQQLISNTTVTSGNNNSAENLSERIRRIVMEHNHLQSLLVNIIRQHDRQRDLLFAQSWKGQLISASTSPTSTVAASDSTDNQQQQQQQLLRLQLSHIDLADIAEALDDGCLCSCHSQQSRDFKQTSECSTVTPPPTTATAATSKSTTLPSLASSSLSLLQPASRKVKRLKKIRANSAIAAGSRGAEGQSREEIIQQLSDKLCENCFETHYWLHGCCSSLELTQSTTRNSETPSSTNSNTPQQQKQQDQLKASIVALRNATFIKLVQQQVRSTISKSIELIDLIRREIKSPESIKQKQLMRCFSASIQLLTSVANYVVPAQDISSFIPEIGNHQSSGNKHKATSTASTAATLFNLPPSDFDHSLLFPDQSGSGGSHRSSRAVTSSPHHDFYAPPSATQQSFNPFSYNQNNAATNYHLAPAPEVPIRRRTNNTFNGQQLNRHTAPNLATPRPRDSIDSSKSLPATTRGGEGGGGATAATRRHKQALTSEQLLSFNLQKLRTNDSMSLTDNDYSTGKATNNTVAATPTASLASEEHQMSSSGASSNNSSASSSIARGTVPQLQPQVQLQQQQLQSSLTKTRPPGAILDGKASQVQHDQLGSIQSFEPIVNHSKNNQLHNHHQRQQLTPDDDLFSQARPKFWQSSKFNFIRKLLYVKQQRLLRQQSKDRRIYNNKVQNKFRLVMMDLTHFNKSQQLLTTENGVNSLLTSMRNVLEFGLYLTLKLY